MRCEGWWDLKVGLFETERRAQEVTICEVEAAKVVEEVDAL